MVVALVAASERVLPRLDLAQQDAESDLFVLGRPLAHFAKEWALSLLALAGEMNDHLLHHPTPVSN